MCGECAKWDVLRASFDGVDTHDQPYEFKAPSKTVWDDLEANGVESTAFKLYEAQVQAQLTVAGQSTGRLIFYREDGADQDFEIRLTPNGKTKSSRLPSTFGNWSRLSNPLNWILNATGSSRRAERKNSSGKLMPKPGECNRNKSSL